MQKHEQIDEAGMDVDERVPVPAPPPASVSEDSDGISVSQLAITSRPSPRR